MDQTVSTRSSSHRFHAMVFAAVAVITVSSAIGTKVVYMQSEGDSFSSGGNPNVSADPLGALGGGGGGNGALFRAPQDNTRHRWMWTEDGWTLETNEETYQNGWHWSWTENGWQWLQQSLHGAADDQMSSEPAVAMDEAGCFSSDGMWTTDRSSCASDQAEAALRTDGDTMPEEFRQMIRDAAPVSADEEREIGRKLTEAFAAPVISADRSSALRMVQVAVSRLQILQESTVVTDTEREYFVKQIAALQKHLTRLSDADTRSSLDAAAADALSLTAEVSSFVSEHGIRISMQDAPTAGEILMSADSMLQSVSRALSILAENGKSTGALMDAYRTSMAVYADVLQACTVTPRECYRVSEVVASLEKTVTALQEFVEQNGDQRLIYDVQHVFQGAR